MVDKLSQYAAETACDRFDGDMTGAQAHSIRERLGLTQAWLAEASGTREVDVARWEHSNHTVPWAVANALFEAFQRTRHAVATLAAELKSGATWGRSSRFVMMKAILISPTAGTQRPGIEPPPVALMK